MAGKNQHYIPQFLQRGFAVEGSNGNKIWRIEKKRWIPTKPGATKSSASENWFYSEVSTDGGRTLDDKITDQEGAVILILTELIERGVGSVVEPSVAADLVLHFAPRTKHLRQIFERGLGQVAVGSKRFFSDQDSVKRYVGLDHTEPDEAFCSHMGDLLKNEVLLSLPIPPSVVERIAFNLAKEQFETIFESNQPALTAFSDRLLNEAGKIARDGHVNALDKLGVISPRHDFLKSLSWQIVMAPEGGGILPDCVVLAFDAGGEVIPFMFSGASCSAVAMPLNNNLVLQGRTEGYEFPEDFDFNNKAAKACYAFFLSATKSEAVLGLQSLIGECPSRLIDEAVDGGLSKLSPLPSEVCAGDISSGELESLAGFVTNGPIGFQISILGCSDEAVAKSVAANVKWMIQEIRRSLPLNRLDGITFAADYPKALQEVDRGIPGAAPPTTCDGKVGKGIGQGVFVVRDGVLKTRIVMDCCVCNALVSEDESQVIWAVGVLSRQLIRASLTEVIDVALPGVQVRPAPDYFTGKLYSAVSGAGEAYIASYLCAGFGDSQEKIQDCRQLLTTSLNHMQKNVLSARYDYRTHGDLDALLDTALSLFRYVLLFAADLLGLCNAVGVDAVVPDSALEEALNATGLKLWLFRYHEDLERFRMRLGRWESLEEFLFLNVHVERLMWQFGMFPWKEGDYMRVEIPIGSDAEGLIADIAAGKVGV